MKLFGPRYPEEIAKRIPPGQRLVKTWPVLHFGPIPDFDESTWNLEVNGLVDNPYSLTYAELKELGPVDVEADMHCVTGWSTLDNTWTGVPFRVLAEKAGVQDDAKWVIAHCDYGYTSDLSLQAMLDDDVLVAWAHGGEPLDRRARVPAPSRRAQALRVEEREVAPRARVLGAEQARVLGGARVPHPRRALGRGALLVPGRPPGRARAVAA